MHLLEIRTFTYSPSMHGWCAASALTLPMRRPRAHRPAGFSIFFPSNYHSNKNIFLSYMGVMLFQVLVMNKLVHTLHVSELMQKDDRLVVGGCCQGLGGKEQHQVIQQRC